MQNTSRAKLGLVAVVVLATGAASGDTKEFRYTVKPGATVTVINYHGPTRVRAVPADQVVVNATPNSANVTVDCRQADNHVEVRTRFPEKETESEAVDYEIQVPADANITIRTASGPVQVQGVNGEIAIDADTGEIEVRDSSGHVRVRTVGGRIALSDLRGGMVEARSVGGDVTLAQVSGKNVSVSTTGGAISYTSDFAGGGQYLLSSHSGPIVVTVPSSASVDVSAHSVSGTVENDFPANSSTASRMALAQTNSLAAKSNTAAPSLQLQTFSGKIRVKKQ